ncbi:MAG: hypothetical protein KatS3mg110_3078 [Pirellulaceae bacterium]|nr:MAG: hypothetical protein KatS3mg110_3078 [Pirellulaceae bacterium]
MVQPAVDKPLQEHEDRKKRVRPAEAPPRASLPAPPAMPLADKIGRPPIWWSALRRGLVPFLVSFVVHAVLLLALALWVIPRVHKPNLVLDVYTENRPELLPLADTTFSTPLELPDVISSELPAVEPSVPESLPPLMGSRGGAAGSIPVPAVVSSESLEQLLRPSHVAVGGGYEGRRPELRARLAMARGGTPASEQAVELGLAWLAAHQWSDGGWRFDHTQGPCQGQCRDPGRVATSTGATGLALLAFLGAGYTHQDGPYRDVVQRGLYYLGDRMQVTPHGGDLQEGTMYGHGIATLALCEAYAMTRDSALRPIAQQAVDFICWAQHPQGGWRYVPGQPGDTTVFGWQIMALKSARLGGLDVPSPVIDAAMHYLDSVQAHGGATYGYQKPGNDPSPTAIGLLARMYYGWKRNDPRLIKGVGILEQLGPSDHDVYFDYYATQVLHHFQGSGWERWNKRLRDYLVATQAQNGHERGSWFFADRHGSFGGRHYTTAMCIMILEVYYRHMPLYDAPAIDVGF